MGWARTDMATRNAYDRAYRAQRRARGLCAWCPATSGRPYLCLKCARRRAVRVNARRAAARLLKVAA